MSLNNISFIKQGLLPDQIADVMREAIIKGVLLPGARLVENDLSKQLGVSRIPLREAFRVLEGEGLVTISPHKGAMVSELKDEELLELFTVRALFESYAAQYLADIRGASVVPYLESIIQQMKSAIGIGDIQTYCGLAADFHEALITGCKNSILIRQYEQIKVKLHRYQAALSRLSDSPQQSIFEHQKIVTFIKSGDKAQAAKATKEHIDALIIRFLDSKRLSQSLAHQNYSSIELE
jgi:DNA-binding GntR family transcriptional regulator